MHTTGLTGVRTTDFDGRASNSIVGALTVAATVSGLILDNNMQGVDFLFSLAQATYRDLSTNGKWNAAMRPTPGTPIVPGGFIAADQITGPFCWNCESTEGAFLMDLRTSF